MPSTPPKSIVNSIGMTLELIPAGGFDMGTSPEEMEAILQIPDVRPRAMQIGAAAAPRADHPAVLSGGDRGDTWPVQTVRGGRRIPDRGRTLRRRHRLERGTEHVRGHSPAYSWRNPGFQQTDEHPVLNVSWNDAMAFCAWLSRTEKSHLPATHGSRMGIRLPGRDHIALRQR